MALGFWLRISHKSAIRTSARVQSSEGLSRAEVLFLRLLIYTHGKLLLVVGRRPCSLPRAPLHGCLSIFFFIIGV